MALVAGCLPAQVVKVPLSTTHTEKGLGPRPTIQAWIGISAGTMFKELGAPARQIALPEGGMVYTYSRSRTVTNDMVMRSSTSAGSGTAVAQALGAIAATDSSGTAGGAGGAQAVATSSSMRNDTTIAGGGATTVFCETNFAVSADGFVTGVQLQGDGCASDALAIAPPAQVVSMWKTTMIDLEVADVIHARCTGPIRDVMADPRARLLRAADDIGHSWKVMGEYDFSRIGDYRTVVAVRFCTTEGGGRFAVAQDRGIVPIPVEP